MTRSLYLIYVPGLGDSKPAGQALAVRTWRWRGVEAELLRMNWSDAESWESKLQRLVDRIDELAGAGKRVALVGSSAGGAAVINALAARKAQISGCVIIAGKVNHPDSIREHYRRDNPAFVMAAKACERALESLNEQDRKRILSRYALFDGIVGRSDSVITGARNEAALSVGHAFTIATQIVFGLPRFVRFLRGLDELEQ